MAPRGIVSNSFAVVAIGEAYAVTQATKLNVSGASNRLANDLGVVTINTTPAVAPQHGILTLSSDGSFIYDPHPTFVGTDTFTYEATGNGGTRQVEVTLTVKTSMSVRLAIVRNDMATRVKVEPTHVGIIGRVIGEKWGTGGAILQENCGNVLYLDDFAGKRIRLTYTARYESSNDQGYHEISQDISVAVPVWASTVTMDDTLAPSNRNGTSWRDAITKLAAATKPAILRVATHRSGEWVISGSDYWLMSNVTHVAIKGDNATTCIINGDKENATVGQVNNRGGILRLSTVDDVSISNLIFRNGFKAGLLIGTGSNNIDIRNVTFKEMYGHGIHLSPGSGNKGFTLSNIKADDNETPPPDYPDAGSPLTTSPRGVLIETGSSYRMYQVSANRNSFDGIDFEKPTAASILDDIELWNCDAMGNGRQGLLLWGCSNAEVLGGTFVGNLASGIQVEGNGRRRPINILIYGARSIGNNNQSTVNHEAGVWLEECDASLLQDGYATKNDVGIYLGKDANRTIIRNNRVVENQGQFHTAQPTTSSWGLYITEANDDCSIYQNTFFRNGRSTSAPGATHVAGSGIYVQLIRDGGSALSTELLVRSNIFSDHTLNALGNSRQVYLRSPNVATALGAFSEFDNNIHWNPPRDNGWGVGLRDARSFVSYQRLGFEPNSAVVNPKLNADGTVPAKSPAVGASEHICQVFKQSGNTLTVDRRSVFRAGDIVRLNNAYAVVQNVVDAVVTLDRTIAATAEDKVVWSHPVSGDQFNIGAK